MKNLLSKRSLIFFVIALLAVVALAVSLLLEKKQLIDIYEGSEYENEDPEPEDLKPEPVKPRKVGRPAKVQPEPEPTPDHETITPAVEKPAIVIEDETSK